MSGGPFADFLRELRRELMPDLPDPRAADHAERTVEEAREHLEEAHRELIADGLGRDEATREVLRRFGSPAEVAEAYRFDTPLTVDAGNERDGGTPRRRASGARSALGPRTMPRVGPRGREPWWKAIVGELRIALRNLGRARGFACAFIVTLGLGIGANAAIFSVIDGVLLSPLPHREGDRLVYLKHRAERAGVDNVTFSVPEIADFRDRVESFDAVAEFSALTFTVTGLEEPRRLRAGIVTGNYFEVMGLDPVVGRLVLPEDDGEAAAPVAVLAHETWRGLFGSDPEVVGRTLRIDGLEGRNVTVVGVVEQAPPYPERTAFYVNMAASPHHLSASMNHDRVHRMTEVFARLAPGATVEGAAAEVARVNEALHGEYPEAYDATHGYTVSVTGLRDQLTRRARPTLLVLLVAAAFVLMIACANVANLTLARMIRRRDELLVRASLGASSWALRRQLLAEALVPSTIGAALGCWIAYLGVDLLSAYAARFTVRAYEIGIDATVLGVAFAIGVLTACLLAFVPRLPVAAGRRRAAGGRSTGHVGERKLQRSLVVSQVAVGFVLLIGAGLMLRTLSNLQAANGGLELDGVLTMSIPRPGATDEVRTFYDTIVEETRSLPGVRSVALGTNVPLRGVPSIFTSAVPLKIEGWTPEPGEPEPRGDYRPVSAEYFQTLGISLVRGRLFDERDHADSAKVVIINETMARRYFPERDPVGQRLAWTGEVLRWLQTSPEWRTVVGVVSDAADYGLESVPLNTVYQPYSQEPAASALFVRSADPRGLERSVTGLIRELDPDQPIEQVATLEQIHSEVIAPQRLNATLMGGFAALAVAIAAVGVASVLAFSVSQRTRELGIRAALGADAGRLRRSVVSDGATLTLVGLVLGTIGSLGLARFLSGLLFEVGPTDPWTFVGVALLMAVVALGASWVPAWRAARIDPVRALRIE